MDRLITAVRDEEKRTVKERERQSRDLVQSIFTRLCECTFELPLKQHLIPYRRLILKGMSKRRKPWYHFVLDDMIRPVCLFSK